MKAIPRLANSADDVLSAALKYDTGGYLLKFNVIGEGEWQFNRAIQRFEKTGKVGKVPVIAKTEPETFDLWLIGQIAKGFVTISCGDSRNYWELHRATGTPLAA